MQDVSAQQAEPITITLQHASELSGLSVDTLRRYIRKGYLSSVRTDRRILIHRDSLVGYLRNGEPGSDQATERPTVNRLHIRSGPGKGFNMEAFARIT